MKPRGDTQSSWCDHYCSQVTGDENMQMGGLSADALDHDSLATLGSLKFTEWFTWCHSCKHGKWWTSQLIASLSRV